MASDRNSPRTSRKPSGRPFKKGESGNPNGRPPGIVSKPSTLPISKAIAAVELSKEGYTPERIAQMLNAKPEAVKDALAQSLRLMQMCAPAFAEHWLRASQVAAEDGDHKPAMAALQSIKVIEPVAQTYDTGSAGAKAVAAVKVEVHGFNFAGLPPQATDETIDVTASTQP